MTIDRLPFAGDETVASWRPEDTRAKEGEAMTDEFVKKVCAPVPGPDACSYLLMGPKGWSCAKAEAGLKTTIDERRSVKAMRAMGDNCSGPPLYELPQRGKRQ